MAIPDPIPRPPTVPATPRRGFTQVESGSESRLLTALDELGRVAVAETDLVQLARFTTAVIKGCLGLTHVAMALVDHDRQLAEYLAEASDLPVILKPGDTQPLIKGLVGKCVREGRTLFVEDVRADPSYVEIIPGVASELVVPVMSRGRVIAVLNCESRDPEVLRERAVFLEVAANRLGVAIDNARLLREREEALSQARRHAQELSILNAIARTALVDPELRPMLKRVTDAMGQMLDWEFVACMSVDLERRRFVCEAVTSRGPTEVRVGYGRELGSGVVGEVALTGEPLLIDDVRSWHNYVETLPGAMSELCVPVKHAGRTVALINLESTRLAAFHDQLPLLQTIADQVAGAIYAARLYHEARQRAGLLEVIGELTRHAMEATDLQELLDRVAREVQRHLGLAVAAFVLLSEDGKEVELLSHVGDVPLNVAKGARWRADQGIVGRAMRIGEPLLITDVRADPDYLMIAPSVTAEYAVPIRFRDRTLGVMNVEATGAEVFTAENRGFIRTLVDQVAGAIHLASVNRRLAAGNRLLQDLFSRYVSPDVADLLVQDPERFANRGERRQATVLFADIRGFTRATQRVDSQAAMELLNAYYTAMGEAITAEQGTINLIAGDGFMAVFGVPHFRVDHPAAAVRAARAMHAAAARLQPVWRAVTGEDLRIVVAINTGELILGNIGDPRHMQFTVLGDVVNVAARLEAEAKARDVPVLATAEVVRAAGGIAGARALGALELRGREGTVDVFEIPTP